MDRVIKAIQDICDTLTEFDELSFIPATLTPNPEQQAKNWKRSITKGIYKLYIALMQKFTDYTKISEEINNINEKIINDYERKIEDGEFVSKEWHDEQALHANNEIEILKDKIERIEKKYKGKIVGLLIDVREWINGNYDEKLDTYCIHVPAKEVDQFINDKAKEYGVEEYGNK